MWKDIAFLSESSFIINVSETFWTVRYYPEKRTAVVFSQIIAWFHLCEIKLKIFKGQVLESEKPTTPIKCQYKTL